MKRLTEVQCEALLQHMQKTAHPGDNPEWDRLHDEWGSIIARLEMPMGELTNSHIAGFVWAWNIQGRIVTAPITKHDKFNAQGLEGKVTVSTDLVGALLAWRELPKYRRALSVERMPKCE